jgi:hypothetical protein
MEPFDKKMSRLFILDAAWALANRPVLWIMNNEQSRDEDDTPIRWSRS